MTCVLRENKFHAGNKETMPDVSKEAGLEVYVEKTKYMFVMKPE
jgi:hypothetical protein